VSEKWYIQPYSLVEDAAQIAAAAMVGLYKLNAVDP
jgi:hypothetical protein